MSQTQPPYHAGPDDSPFRRIREAYGGNNKAAINRAIRAEVPGGRVALDRLADWHHIVVRHGWADDQPDEPLHVTAFRHLLEIVDAMELGIREKYGLPPAPPREDLRRSGKSIVAAMRTGDWWSTYVRAFKDLAKARLQVHGWILRGVPGEGRGLRFTYEGRAWDVVPDDALMATPPESAAARSFDQLEVWLRDSGPWLLS